MKTSTKVFIGIGLFVLLYILLKLDQPTEEDLALEQSNKEEVATLINQAYRYAENGFYDSAYYAVNRADSLNNHIRKAGSVLELKYSLKRIMSKEAQDSILAAMDDDSYEALKKKNYVMVSTYPVAILDDSLEHLFLNNLRKRTDRKEVRGAWVKAAERERIAEAKITMYKRAEFKEILRNIFLDSGLDIEVEVDGKYNDKLTLKYPLFNAVWKRKFEKEGLFTKWHEMGFNEIILTDSYDYYDGVKWTVKN